MTQAVDRGLPLRGAGGYKSIDEWLPDPKLDVNWVPPAQLGFVVTNVRVHAAASNLCF